MPRRLAPEAVTFQSDLEEILAEKPPLVLRSVTLVLAAMLVGILALAGVLRTDIVVAGNGRLASDRPTIVLQPIERSVIKTLAVRRGDRVRRGQVLATLDATFTKADVGALQTALRAAGSRLRRLEAELAGSAFTSADPDDAEERLQKSLLEERRAQYRSKIAAFEATIRGDEAALAGAEDDREATARQLAIARSIESLRLRLLRDAVGSRLQFLESQTVRLETERRWQAAGERVAGLQHEIDSRRAEQGAFAEGWRRDLYEELASGRAEQARVEATLIKASRLDTMVRIEAPEDGVVLDVASRSVGSILREAEPLITLMPQGAGLVAQVDFGSADVGHLRAGQMVIVKVDAFPYQQHGVLHGRVRSVAGESFTQSDGAVHGLIDQPASRAPFGAFHRAEIDLIDQALPDLPAQERAMPGMTLAAEVKVGTRSLLAYFLYPVTRGFGESLREP